MYTLAFVNQKGGVGKTTLCTNMALRLQAAGAKVLLVDMDPQCNLTYVVGQNRPTVTVWDVLSGKVRAREAIVQGQQIDILPGSPNLSLAEQNLRHRDKNTRLRKALEPLKEEYHYILIDSPPALGLLMLNVLSAADSVVIPALADVFSLQGIGQLASTIRSVQRQVNPRLAIDGIVLSRTEGQSQLDQDMTSMLEDTAQKLGTAVFATRIHTDAAVREAQAMRQSVFEYAPQSRAAAEYSLFTLEYLKRLRKRLQIDGGSAETTEA